MLVTTTFAWCLHRLPSLFFYYCSILVCPLTAFPLVTAFFCVFPSILFQSLDMMIPKLQRVNRNSTSSYHYAGFMILHLLSLFIPQFLFFWDLNRRWSSHCGPPYRGKISSYPLAVSHVFSLVLCYRLEPFATPIPVTASPEITPPSDSHFWTGSSGFGPVTFRLGFYHPVSCLGPTVLGPPSLLTKTHLPITPPSLITYSAAVTIPLSRLNPN